MDPLELRRSDIGFGRVIVDDAGVTRRTLFSSATLAWDDIRDYRLTIEMPTARSEARFFSLDDVNALLFLRDLYRGWTGKHAFRLGIVLVGEPRDVAFNWRFRGVDRAIARVLERVAPRLAVQARERFAREGVARFGKLAIADRFIQWSDRRLLPRDEVEAVELFNSSPVRLRVMAHGKAWPYCQRTLARIPNVMGALEIAQMLGYRVRGTALLPTTAAT